MKNDFLLDHAFKGYPFHRGACLASGLGSRGWNVLANDLAFPLAVIREDALAHNIRWMQAYVERRGVSLAPHAKTPLSPQLCERQLAAGAWGLTFATVHQVQVGIWAGAQRIIIANQMLSGADLAGICSLLDANPGLRIWFLLDSMVQLAIIEDWCRCHAPARCFDVLLEVGLPGQRTGCRSFSDAMVLARAAAASPAVRLGGIECYEGGLAQCDSRQDTAAVTALVRCVTDVIRAGDTEGLFGNDELLVSAGGSAVFDLVMPLLQLRGTRLPMRGVLRSGCYLTHDHGSYARFLTLVEQREGMDSSLQAALCVWTLVQSVPEPGLALLTCGRRDISFDQQMPVPIHHATRGSLQAQPAPTGWVISALNDQHAYLRFDPAGPCAQVGDRVGLGISHPCTTFDKWRWMALTNSDWTVTGAISTHF